MASFRREITYVRLALFKKHYTTNTTTYRPCDKKLIDCTMELGKRQFLILGSADILLLCIIVFV